MPLLRWISDPPALRQPVLLVALDGFVDAGAVAATAAMFLRHRWRSEPVARFDRDAFIDYRARRPTAVVDSGVLRRVEWPDIELLTAQVEGPRDVALLLGPEPDMRWEAFSAEVAEACRRLGVEMAIGLGAYPAAAPHTRPVRIVQARNHVVGDVVPEAGEVTGYTGPVGAGTVLQFALGEAGIPSVGLWAEVPHYIAASPYPAAALEMVRLVARTLRTDVDTTELEAAAKLHEEQVAEAVASHPDAVDMVRALERHVDAGEDEPDLPSGEDIAAEIERFLRAQSE
ncbi:MAG TPA: PAC2 family protein [Egibacteraceae bacterium]|nr:PAC2 family protein [Egibacteraceae bacterium]